MGGDRINFVIFPSANPVKSLQEKYEKREGKNSIVKLNKKENGFLRNYKIVMADVLNKNIIKKNKEDKIADTRSFIRHDSDKLANVILAISELDSENLIKEIV
ncbi:MAG: hypothetical protein ACD_7C00311G0002 [uncultured bacterium]|nr:MAG: hypothetical protein ACD_7C00311G0002 [uncultured bacterium]HBR79873.1 hypothetical protein [Candidatus Moranbacteria bacterium]